MEISIISNILQQIVDKVLTFRDRKINSNEKILNEILDPLFTELTVIVENYFEIFQTAKMLILNTSGKNSNLPIEEISKLREANLIGRIKMRELIKILGTEYTNPHLKDFATKTEKFFYSSEVITRKMSLAKNLVFELYDYVKEDDIDKNILLKHIDLTIERMEVNWSSIVQSYAHIRIKLIKAKISERFK